VIENIHGFFETHEGEFLKFERVENKHSTRSDIHAFIVLDKLFPSARDMVSAAEHEEIYLDVNPEELAEKATEDQVIELIRCGVRYDSSTDSLAMFV
jgi:hypothetical protein